MSRINNAVFIKNYALLVLDTRVSNLHNLMFKYNYAVLVANNLMLTLI